MLQNPSYTKLFRVGDMVLVYLRHLQQGEPSMSPHKLVINKNTRTLLEDAAHFQGGMASLRTSADKCTPHEETTERKQTYGENRYPRNPVRGFVSFVWEALRNRTLVIMLVCAALSFALGIKMDGIKEGWYGGTSITVEVCMVILVTAMSNYKLQGLQFEALIDYEKNIQVKVIRGGRHMCVSKYELVVGDIVYFNTGDCIPANGILVDGHTIKIDSSTIGRKTELSQVNAEHPILQSGCKVVNGYGTMVITGVGMHSEWGKLMTSTSEDNKTETPLQVHLNGVNTLITKINNLIACLLFIILVVFYFIGHSTPLEGLPLPKFKRGATSVWEAIDAVINIFIIAVTIMVVDAPEGLLFAVTLMRTYSMRKMMADKALVCRTAACETMAFATTICVNMTGTLTLNKMMNIEKAAWIAGSVREGIEGQDANIENLLHAEGIRHNNHGNVFISESNINEMEVSAIKDPCRPGVLDAVRLCQGAGVRVCMLTEDNLLTAKAIAIECGILREGDLAVDGSTLLNYSNYERKKKLPLISVTARCLPSDKVMMVKTLQDMGEVVMVTGDGANDVPSFRQADISLSMGIQGTKVAKESSDIIILNDDFHSIVKAICWGRFVYVNIQKFIELKLTVNMAAFVINIVSMMTSGAVLLTTVQLLWVNLIMDFMLGAFALGEEPPTDELMKRGPIKRSKPRITCVMWCNLLGQSLFQVIIMLTFHFKAEDIFKLRSKPDAYAIKSTIIFTTFMLGQVFNEAFMLCQVFDKFKIFRGMSRNQMFVGIIAATLIMQVAIVEFLPKFASTHKLSWHLWLSCIGIGFLSSLVAFLLRLIPLPFDKDDTYCGYGNKKKRALEKRAHINKNANNNDSDEARVDITDHN